MVMIYEPYRNDGGVAGFKVDVKFTRRSDMPQHIIVERISLASGWALYPQQPPGNFLFFMLKLEIEEPAIESTLDEKK